jgi:hypothetical protein
MLAKRLVVGAATIAIALGIPAGALATPTGGGQPNQSCEDQPTGPPGFDSGGFGIAVQQYAGSGPGSVNHAGSDKAVSQYDVACFQLSQSHPPN